MFICDTVLYSCFFGGTVVRVGDPAVARAAVDPVSGRRAGRKNARSGDRAGGT